jgi:hypothetical protein
VSIFNLFKQNRSPLRVGEVRDDRIGCYLFGVEMPDGSEPSYHSVATTRDELINDCMEFFTTLANRKRELAKTSPNGARHGRDLKVILNAINNLPMFIDIYLKQGLAEPFFEFPGMRIFLRTGERSREKVHGKYLE